MVKRGFKFVLLLGLVAAITAPVQAQLADGLVAYWPFDGNFEDSINGYHGESSETVDGSASDSFRGRENSETLFDWMVRIRASTSTAAQVVTTRRSSVLTRMTTARPSKTCSTSHMWKVNQKPGP